MARNVQEYKTDVHNNWCPGCVLPGTLIHTNPELKPIEQLKAGDRVLGLDGRYHRVTEVFHHRHRGLMYRLRAKCFGETVLTPEHPVLIARRGHPKRHNERFELIWERVDRIHKGDYLAYPIPMDVVDVERLPLPEKLFMDRKSLPLPDEVAVSGDFLRLAGYYIAEGWIDIRPEKKGKLESAVCFAFHLEERGLVDDVRRIVRKLFRLEVTVKERSRSHQITVYVNSSRLARAFRAWFESGAQAKRLPHFMLLLPFEKQRELLKGLWRGDGWLDPQRARAHYKTISKVLCEQVKLLLLRQGIAPSVYVAKASGMHKESYTIFITGKRDVERLLQVLGLPPRDFPEGRPPSTVFAEEVLPDGSSRGRKHLFLMVPVASVKPFEYDGEVWNLEVKDVECYVSESATLHNCGDFGILNAVQMALAKLDIEPYKVALFSGIGCSGKTPHYVKVYGVHTLHGRVLPFATGAKLANPELTVIAVGGDGDGLGIGAGHFVNAGRRNVDLTYIVHDNGVYGLTKGQASPTLKLGMKTKGLPQPNINEGINPLALAFGAGFTFIARGYAFDIPHLIKLIQQGIQHKGMAFIDVLQPCPTYNDINTREWYNERVYKLEDEGYDPLIKPGMDDEEIRAKVVQFMRKAAEWNDRIPIGVLLKNETATSYEERIAQRLPVYPQAAPATRPICDAEGRPLADLSAFFEELRVT
jgi:2-oxoglutarate ferredoxin oxidoreductase subunit beta